MNYYIVQSFGSSYYFIISTNILEQQILSFILKLFHYNNVAVLLEIC